MKKLWNKIPEGGELIIPSILVFAGLLFIQFIFIAFTEDWFNWRPSYFIKFTLNKFSLINGILLLITGLIGIIKNLTFYDYEVKDWSNFIRSFAIFFLYLIAGYVLMRQ